MILLVCGSRDWPRGMFADPIGAAIEWLAHMDDPTLIHGNAPGADLAARDYARAHHGRIRIEKYPADWQTHGKAAGPIRNQQMIDQGCPWVVWAFVTKPLAESRGTADMVRRARASDIPVCVTRIHP